MSLRSLLSRAVMALLFSASAALASQPFDQTSFSRAQIAGQPVVVHVTASWCPTCRIQKPIVSQLEASDPKLKVFTVDFDSQKEVLKRLEVTEQSTLIVYNGTTEVGRSTGDTDPGSIRQLIGKASMGSSMMPQSMPAMPAMPGMPNRNDPFPKDQGFPNQGMPGKQGRF